MSVETHERHSDAIEDYAKAIYALSRRGGGVVSTNALAERLGVTPASASAMVKKLAERGLAAHAPYKGVELTGAGERVALEVLRHHRLLELYLSEHLGLVVHPVPRHPERGGEEELEQPVVAQHLERDALALGSQRDAAIGNVLGEAALGQPLDHR